MLEEIVVVVEVDLVTSQSEITIQSIACVRTSLNNEGLTRKGGEYEAGKNRKLYIVQAQAALACESRPFRGVEKSGIDFPIGCQLVAHSKACMEAPSRLYVLGRERGGVGTGFDTEGRLCVSGEAGTSQHEREEYFFHYCVLM